MGGHAPDKLNGNEPLNKLCQELHANLLFVLTQQQQAQQELLAHFLMQAQAVSQVAGPAAATDFLSTQGTAAATESSFSPRGQVNDASDVFSESRFANAPENDIEWLDHSVLQPAVRKDDGKQDDGKLEDHEKIATKCVELIERCKQISEPPRSGCVHALTENKYFNFICVLVIITNACVIVITTDRGVKEHLGQDNSASWEIDLVSNLELVFMIFYIFELGLKLIDHRFYFFINREWSWNNLDFCLVCLSAFDVIAENVLNSSGDMNVSFLRTLRLLKVSKVFRIFRALKFIPELRLMLDMLLGCFQELFWAIVMISFLIFLFSIVFVQGYGSYLDTADGIVPETERKLIDTYFGSVAKGMVSLVQASTGGQDWSVFYDLLRSTLAPMYTFAFLFYIGFIQISVLNIVMSVFVDRAMKMAKPTEAELVAEAEANLINDEQKLFDLMEDLGVDRDGDGWLDYNDVVRCMSNQTIREHFDAHGIRFEDTHMFYQMLRMANKEMDAPGVDMKSFVTGCIRLKGEASKVDIHTLAFEVKMMHRLHRQLCKYCHEHLSSLDSKIGKLAQYEFSESPIPRQSREHATGQARGLQREQGAERQGSELPNQQYLDCSGQDRDKPLNNVIEDTLTLVDFRKRYCYDV